MKKLEMKKKEMEKKEMKKIEMEKKEMEKKEMEKKEMKQKEMKQKEMKQKEMEKKEMEKKEMEKKEMEKKESYAFYNWLLNLDKIDQIYYNELLHMHTLYNYEDYYKLLNVELLNINDNNTSNQISNYSIDNIKNILQTVGFIFI